MTTNKRNRFAVIIAALALLAGACSRADAPGSAVSDDAPTATVSGDAAEETTETDAVAVGLVQASAANQESHLDEDDLDYDEADVVQVVLQGSSATTDGAGVEIDAATVTITSGGVYSINGSLTDGSIVVDVGEENVTLLLDDADITNSVGAAIAFMSADRAIVVAVDGTTNALTDGATYVFDDDGDEPNAALFSAADLTIAGEGQLVITGHYNDGVASKDGLVIESGTISVTAVDDGIRGKDYVIIGGGTISVVAGGDAIKADNDEDAERGYVQVSGGRVDLLAGDDGVQAATDVIVTDGELTIDAGAGSGTGRALQGDVLVAVGGGVIEASAADDAIHSNDTVTIGGGDVTLDAGDDGIHGDLEVTIHAGAITITDAYEGIEAEVITINGGEIDITSDDDGLNVASAEASAEVAADPQAGRGGGRGGGGGPGVEVVGDHYIFIHGGIVTITITGTLAEQGDGIDANGHVEMTGGMVVVSGPTDTRNSAIDYSGGTFVLTGGTFIGTNVDGRNSEGVGTGSSQASLYVIAPATLAAGTVVQIDNAEGESVVTFEPVNDYSVVVFSSPDLHEGASYDVYLGGELFSSVVAAVPA